jgi:hypothetical protein
MTSREENYAKHLRSLSDEEFNLLSSEYLSLTTVITKLIKVSNTINDYRQKKLDELNTSIFDEKYELLIIHQRINRTPEWKQTQHKKNQIKILISKHEKLSLFCDNIFNNFEIILDIDMRRDMTETIIELMQFKSIEEKLNIQREFLIMRELEYRNHKEEFEFTKQKSTYVDRCIAYLIDKKIIQNGEEFDYDDDKIISLTHISRHSQINCFNCYAIDTDLTHEDAGIKYFKVSDWQSCCEECRKRMDHNRSISCCVKEAFAIPCDITKYNNDYNFDLDYIGICLCRCIYENKWKMDD